jgi:hypothetical protein
MPVPRCGFNRARDIRIEFKGQFCHIVHGDFTPVNGKPFKERIG